MKAGLRRTLVWVVVVGSLAWASYQAVRGVRLGSYSVGALWQERTVLSFAGESWRDRAQGGSPLEQEGGNPHDGEPVEEPPVRNVILVIADGLGFNQLTAARAELVGPNGRLFVETLPISTWVTTHSVDDMYTDSAASASAMATGFKHQTRAISQTDTGERPRTLAESAISQGAAVGLITSTVVLDATPAAFTAHAADRKEWVDIARQMAASGAELLISEEYEPRDDEWRGIWAQALAEFEVAGFRHLTSWEELRSAPGALGERTLALLPAKSIARERSPSLAELAELALARFAAADSGFFLLVEDEESDTGSHRNDLSRAVAAVADLDEVVRRAVEFAREDGRTLVLVTADHETGGFLMYEGEEGQPLSYRYSSESHTNGPVPLLAYGPGAERFSGVLDNTDIPRRVAALTGWELDDG